MLFYLTKVPFKVYSILSKLHWACCGSYILKIKIFGMRPSRGISIFSRGVLRILCSTTITCNHFLSVIRKLNLSICLLFFEGSENKIEFFKSVRQLLLKLTKRQRNAFSIANDQHKVANFGSF